jgi:hypothetical protein
MPTNVFVCITLGAVCAAFAIVLTAKFSVVSAADPALADANRTITSRDLATLRDLRSLNVSPDGAWAAFQVVQANPDRNAYEIDWYVRPTTNAGQAHKVADAGDVGPNFALGFASRDFGAYEPPPPVVWSPDSAWITYLRWDGDHAQIWRTRRSGGAAEQLTHSKSHVRRFVYSADGARILYETEPSLAQIRDALAAEGRTGFLFDGRFHPGYDRGPVLSATQSTQHSVWSYELDDRRERLATSAEQVEFKSLIAQQPRSIESIEVMSTRKVISRNGAVAWTEARDPDRQGHRAPRAIVAQLPERAGVTMCDQPECRHQIIARLWWRNDQELIFMVFEKQRTVLRAWKPADGRIRTILDTPAKLLRHLSSTGDAQSSCHIGADRLICFYEDSTTPRRLVAIDLDSGSMHALYDPNPGIAQFDLGPAPQPLEFVSGSGVTYTGALALPPRQRAGERLPLVVVTYICSGFLRGEAGDEYPVYALAGQGFAVLCLRAPEDTERGATMDSAAYQRWYQGPEGAIAQRFVESLKAAIAYLDDYGIIDPDRVAVTGLSHGAQLTGWGIIGAPYLNAAITSGAPGGVGGPSNYYLLPAYFRDAIRNEYGLGSPRSTPKQWEVLSFSAHVNRVRMPLLINVADHELMSALEPAVELRSAGRSVEMYVYPDEFHWKWQPAHRLAIYNRNIDWMNFWLRGVESNLSNNPDQYVRWRTMRENQCRLFGPGGAEYSADTVPWYCRPGALAAAAQN